MRRILPLLLALPLLCQAPAAVAPAPALKARFLGKAEAAQVLTQDDYFGLLQAAELRAKTGLPLADMAAEQARTAAKAHYAAAAQDFTPGEETMLQGVLDRTASALAAKLPLFARTPFSFIKADVEGGLPHTRGACIVLAPGILGAMVAMEKRDAARLDGLAAGLLIHEQTHVVERQHPDLFADLFTSAFGFKRLASVPDAPALQAARVVNPDGPDLGWAFPIPDGKGKRWIRPDLLLKDLDHPRMPQDFRPVAVDLVESGGTFKLELDAEGHPKAEDLDAVAAYASAFPGVGENFHPNEIAAVILSAWATGQDRDLGPELLARTSAWARKNLR
jgi:hypothetical protein